MKAQARKILALIMAMVMSLSLAAPAFAAEEAVEDTSAEASVVETVEAEETETEEAEEEKVEAPKAEKKAKKSAKLAAQATTYDTKADTEGNFTFAKSEDGSLLATGNVLGEKPNNVTITLVTPATNLIGKVPTGAEYTVVYTGKDAVKDVAAGTLPEGVAYDKDGKKFTIHMPVAPGTGTKTTANITDEEWKPLTDAQATFGNNQVKGSYYEETQPNGTVNVFFKLSTYEDGFDDSKPVILVTKGVAPINNDNAKMADALSSAKTCNDYGETDDGVAIENAKVTKPINAPTTPDTINTVFTVINKVDVTANGNSNALTCSVNEGKTTGTFDVRVQKQNVTHSDKSYYLSTVDEVKAEVEKALEGKLVTVESVVAASGDYFTVTVSKKETADEVKAGWTKNVMKYGQTAVLIDSSKDGWYNGTSKKGANAASVSAGTEATGPVVVRVKDIPTALATDSNLSKVKAVGGVELYKNKAAVDNVTSWNDIDTIVFPSLKATKNVFVAASCKQGASIPYAELKMNAIIGGKVNTLVTVKSTTQTKDTSDEKKFGNAGAAARVESTKMADAADAVVDGIPATLGNEYDHDRVNYTVATATDWYTTAFDTPSAAFVNKGKVEVKAVDHQNVVEVVEETAPTCQKAGSKTTKQVCKDCNTVISEKTEEIPVLSDPIEKKDASDYTKYAFVGEKGSTKHYVAKQENVTTTDTATGMVTVTTTYTCNFGVVHNELTHVETYKKSDLQHSGKWDAITLDKKTAFELWGTKGESNAHSLGLVKSVTIADTDVELTTVPMNRATEDRNKFFTFYTTNLGNANADGNYYAYKAVDPVDVYTSATGLPTTKYYVAKLTIKDLSVGATDCEDASCTVVVDVYEYVKSTGENTPNNDTLKAAISDANLEKNLKDKKVALVKNYSESVVIPGKGHQFFNSLGQATELCTKCGAKKPKETEATNDLSQATITIDPVKYAGTAMTEKDLNITVKLGKTTLARGIDFEVGELNIKAAGKYTVVVAGKGTYNGRQAIELTVTAQSTTAKKQTLKVSVAKKTFKVKTLKKKAQKFTTKLSGAKTAVTWKSSNKKVTVKGSKKKATITVKKGTKKGTYKVTATAKKTGAYKKGTVTVKVIVK